MTWMFHVLISSVLAVFTAGILLIKGKKMAPIVFGLLALNAWGLLTRYMMPFEHVLLLAVAVSLFWAFAFAEQRAQPATQGIGEKDIMNPDQKSEDRGMGGKQEKKRGFLARNKNNAPDGGQPQAPDILAKLAKEPVNTPVDYNAIAHLKKRLMETHEEDGPVSAGPPASPPPDLSGLLREENPAHPTDRNETEQERESFMAEQLPENYDGQAKENTAESQAVPLQLTPEEIKRILTHSAKRLDDDLSLLAMAAEPSAEKPSQPLPEKEPIRHAPPVHRAPPPDHGKNGLNGGDELDDLIQQLSDASQLPPEPPEPVEYEDAYDFTLPDLGETVPYREEPLREPLVVEEQEETDTEPLFREEEEADVPFAPDLPDSETTSIDILLQDAGYPLLGEYALLHQIAVADTTMVDFLINNAYANSMILVENAVFCDAASAKTLLIEADCLERSGQREQAIALTVQICAVCVDSDLTMSAYHLLRRLCQMTGDEETPKETLEKMLVKEQQIVDMLL